MELIPIFSISFDCAVSDRSRSKSDEGEGNGGDTTFWCGACIVSSFGGEGLVLEGLTLMDLLASEYKGS